MEDLTWWAVGAIAVPPILGFIGGMYHSERRLRARTHARVSMAGDARSDGFEDKLDTLTSQVAEIAERQDFVERVVNSERRQLP